MLNSAVTTEATLFFLFFLPSSYAFYSPFHFSLPPIRMTLIGERLFPQSFDNCFAQASNLPYFPDFFFQMCEFNEVVFLLLENFTNSERTPPYIGTYLQLFPNFGNYGKNALR